MSIPVFAPRRTHPLDSGSHVDAPAKTPLDRGREAAALTLFAASLYAGLALASFRGDPLSADLQGGDWVGPVGASFARGAASLLGLVAWGVPFELALFAAPLLRRRPSIANVARFAGDVLVACIVSALLHIAFSQATVFGAMPIGGSFGELFGEVLRSLFSTLGSYIIGLTMIGLILIGRASFSFISWFEKAGRGTGAAASKAKEGARAVAGAWAQARDLERERAEVTRRASEPRIDATGTDQAIIAALSYDEGDVPSPLPLKIAAGSGFPIDTPSPTLLPKVALSGVGEGLDGTKVKWPAESGAAPKRRSRKRDKEKAEGAEPGSAGASSEASPKASALAEAKAPAGAAAGGDPDDEPQAIEAASPPAVDLADNDDAVPQPKRKARATEGPTIIDTSGEMAAKKAPKMVPVPLVSQPAFQLPSTDMLEPPPATVLEIDHELLRKNAKLLEKTLNDYGVQGKVEEIHPGPHGHDVRSLARSGDQGLEGRCAGRRSRARALAQGAHRRAHPRQEPHRVRDPQRAARAGDPARARRGSALRRA